MLRPRITPFLLIKNGALVKTTLFENAKYVGDPINAVRIFNEKEVDELIVVDMDATIFDREPNFELIKTLASECRMPLCYGGGVKTVEQVQRIISLGAEKVAMSSSAIQNPALLATIASRVGSQSVVVVLDVKKTSEGYRLFTHNGKIATGLNPIAFSKTLEALGAGEVMVNAIDRDGTMTGYDMELIKSIRESTNLPLTVLGGAGSLMDMGFLFQSFGILGAAAGSFFIFKGKFRAVLIRYPSREDKDNLLQSYI